MSKQLGQLGIEFLEGLLANGPAKVDKEGRAYVYVETGRYKPFNISVIAAAKRRGYEVKRWSPGVYYVYTKR